MQDDSGQKTVMQDTVGEKDLWYLDGFFIEILSPCSSRNGQNKPDFRTDKKIICLSGHHTDEAALH